MIHLSGRHQRIREKAGHVPRSVGSPSNDAIYLSWRKDEKGEAVVVTRSGALGCPIRADLLATFLQETAGELVERTRVGQPVVVTQAPHFWLER